MKFLVLCLNILLCVSCAGPMTPFGGDVFISEEYTRSPTIHKKNVDLTFTPGRQYFNSPYDLKIKLTDPDFEINKFRYEIVYNNKVLNRWYKSEEIKFPTNKNDPIEITFKNLSILPGNINKIIFLYYPADSDKPMLHELQVPECFKELRTTDINIAPFEVSEKLESNIKALSEKYKYNPSLVAALIAQESSFNPKALSVAKALGLTQVTPVAHREINRFKKNWRIYPGFSKLPFKKIQKKLSYGKINALNDWRLNQEKSIEGGIIYLEYLQNYWSNPEAEKLLSEVFQDAVPRTDILLASYNSGASRVKTAISTNKKNWLFDKNLNEARKYVMNIKSYCYSFDQGNKDEK